MNAPKLLVLPLAAALLAAAPAARAHEHVASEAPHGNPGAAKAKAVKGAQVVEVSVTKEGFEPSLVTVQHGRPVKLVVTRKVERTCATEIVSKELGINQPLPLDKPVTVKVTPEKPGSYRFSCAMDMIAGTLNVE